mmetsp:Transcript_33721/g.70112  ORF Transcript_33721/g.70112 Transcript_33721/m.70112 type:complete len:229 (-) Transcript_33721:156-842(-)
MLLRHAVHELLLLLQDGRLLLLLLHGKERLLLLLLRHGRSHHRSKDGLIALGSSHHHGLLLHHTLRKRHGSWLRSHTIAATVGHDKVEDRLSLMLRPRRNGVEQIHQVRSSHVRHALDRNSSIGSRSVGLLDKTRLHGGLSARGSLLFAIASQNFHLSLEDFILAFQLFFEFGQSTKLSLEVRDHLLLTQAGSCGVESVVLLLGSIPALLFAPIRMRRELAFQGCLVQ